MSLNLYIGQKLKTTTNEFVTIVKIGEKDIYVDYKGKIYKREKSIIGKKLFVIQNNAEDLSNHSSNPITKSVVEIEKSCNSCMVLKRDECIGKKSICEYYKHSPSISKEEINNWPKFGDATYYRFTNNKK